MCARECYLPELVGWQQPKSQSPGRRRRVWCRLVKRSWSADHLGFGYAEVGKRSLMTLPRWRKTMRISSMSLSSRAVRSLVAFTLIGFHVLPASSQFPNCCYSPLTITPSSVVMYFASPNMFTNYDHAKPAARFRYRRSNPSQQFRCLQLADRMRDDVRQNVECVLYDHTTKRHGLSGSDTSGFLCTSACVASREWFSDLCRTAR